MFSSRICQEVTISTTLAAEWNVKIKTGAHLQDSIMPVIAKCHYRTQAFDKFEQSRSDGDGIQLADPRIRDKTSATLQHQVLIRSSY